MVRLKIKKFWIDRSGQIKGLINRTIPFSSVDGPGNRFVIFFQKCNFNCLYCHNPETINLCNNCGFCIPLCPTKALVSKKNRVLWKRKRCIFCDNCLKVCPHNSSPKAYFKNVDELFLEIKKVHKYIRGITVSGGEPTLQIDFLTELFEKVKKSGLTTFLDTNGSIPLWKYPRFTKTLDMAMVDIKSTDPKEHKKLTDFPLENVVENMKYLHSIGKLYEVRTVIVPQILNNKKNVDFTSKLIASTNKNIRYKIIKYRPFGVREDLIQSCSPTKEKMLQLKSLAQKNGLKKIVLL